MNLLLASRADDLHLAGELSREFPGAQVEWIAPGVATIAPDHLLQDRPPHLAFTQQYLPDAQPCQADSIRLWIDQLVAACSSRLPESQPWQLLVAPHYGSVDAGHNRCELIRSGTLDLLRRRHRQRLRHLLPSPRAFQQGDSAVQLLLTGPDHGWISTAIAPVPFELRHLISPFSKGEIPIASDKAAPSRAFAKLVEAELRLGRPISKNEFCVDLGASPGSWTYIALQRGAHVVAVDRSPLRDDLRNHPRLQFKKGDAFRFQPDSPVDWLLCDVIAAPERSIKLLLAWARERWARHFVVTIKFKGEADYFKISRLKLEMPALTSEFRISRLNANKNELCAYGSLRPR